MALLSDKQQRDLVIALGLLDFVTRGRINAAAFDLTLATIKRVLPAAATAGGRAGLSVAGSLGRAAIPLATNPYVAGTALGYGALQTDAGEQLLQMAEERGRMDRIRFEQGLTDIEFGIKKKVKRTKSKFNSAVSKGMKAVKQSTSYGKKGIINAPKKAFKAVVSMASKLNKAGKKGTKAPKTGIQRILHGAMKGIWR
jgi:hypothetical protein